MTTANTDLATSTDWIDLVATYSGLASVSAWVQNKAPNDLVVVFSASGTAPATAMGYLLARGAQVTGSAAHIWVKSIGGAGVVGCGLA